MSEHEDFRDCSFLEGRITESVLDQLWGGFGGGALPYGFEAEDPTLTGGLEDGDDDRPIVLVNSAGKRFSVEVSVFVQKLPALEEDPDYIEAQLAAASDEPEVVADPNQGVLFGE